jgi:hypothetical protein
MNYAAVFGAANDPVFQGRCVVATWKAAQDVLTESPGTPNYAVRRQWALNTLRGNTAITPRNLAVQVLRNATIAASPATATDNDLQFQVNSILADLIEIG